MDRTASGIQTSSNSFSHFRYDDQVLVEYNVQCKDDQLASYMITDLDIQGRDCDVGNGTYV